MFRNRIAAARAAAELLARGPRSRLDEDQEKAPPQRGLKVINEVSCPWRAAQPNSVATSDKIVSAAVPAQSRGRRIFTRNANDWADRFPAVAGAVAGLAAASCLIDGEIARCNEQGLPDFNLLRRGPRRDPEAVLFAFDLLELEGLDLRPWPIEARKRALAQLLEGAPPALQLVEHLEEDGPVMFAHACRLGCEGIVSKRLGSTYRSGRSPDWLKIKNPAAPAVRREAEEEWGR